MVSSVTVNVTGGESEQKEQLSEILLDRKAAMVASMTVNETVAVNLMMGQKKSRV